MMALNPGAAGADRRPGRVLRIRRTEFSPKSPPSYTSPDTCAPLPLGKAPNGIEWLHFYFGAYRGEGMFVHLPDNPGGSWVTMVGDEASQKPEPCIFLKADRPVLADHDRAGRVSRLVRDLARQAASPYRDVGATAFSDRPIHSRTVARVRPPVARQSCPSAAPAGQ